MTTHDQLIEVRGVPVRARYSITLEDPSVGVFREIEDCTLHGFLTDDRLHKLEDKLTDADWEKIDIELMENHS